MGSAPLVFLPATLEHCAQLAPMLRAADLTEVLSAGHPSALHALEASLRASEWAGTCYLEGQPAVMYGCVPLADNAAVAWCLTGNAVDRHTVAFWGASKRMVAEMLEHYEMLTNRIDARYSAALRWASRLGFTVYPAEPHPVSGAPFCRVVLWRYQ